MNRREFNKIVGTGTIALGFSGTRATIREPSPQFAITMDDFTWSSDSVRLNAEERNQAILDAMRAHSAKAALFVRASNIDDDKGKQLLKTWDTAGHLIGNHTYSHWYYNDAKVTSQAFENDILRAEDLLKDFPRFRKIFRYPYLKEGDTAAKRDALRSFLGQHGYRVGHVTVDSSDWFVDSRLRQRLEKNPSADVAPYRDFYLEHMWDRAHYYDSLARTVLGRSVKHTVLTHFNLLNGLFLGDLIEMFKNKGWQLIDAEEAFTDPVFRAEPKIVPAGESIVWALAKEKGTIDKSLRYPAEDGEHEKAKMDRLRL